jgi:glycosyltransferase involved in cell wall biosynthesis
MACAVPVVASRIRGNVDLIEDGVNGFLCDPQDAEGFAERIRKMLHDPAMREAFRNQGLSKIAAYDKITVAEQMREIYCVVDERGNSSLEKV